MKFKVKHSGTRDKVSSYNEASGFWENDKFIQNCHGPSHPTDKSREGRKLKIAEYYKKMMPKPV